MTILFHLVTGITIPWALSLSTSTNPICLFASIFCPLFLLVVLMSSINLLGDLSELTATGVKFNIAFQVTGASGHVRHTLSGLGGLAPFLQGRAFARIVGDSLTVKVTGSVTQSRSIDVHVCIIPATFPDYPQTGHGVASVPGSCFAQHSVTSSGEPAILSFPDGVANQLKPSPVWGEPPALVVVHEILGGTQTSTATVKVSGVLEVGGIGFVRTWT